MDASAKTIGKILNGDDQYFVPPYQRPYKWDIDDAEKLAQDIRENQQEDVQEYFIGSIICIKRGKGIYEVVDGQQRLITLTLMMQQMRCLVEDEDIRGDLKRRILPVTIYANNKVQRPALKVREAEHNFYFNHVLKGEDIPCQTATQQIFLDNRDKIGAYLSGVKQEDLAKMVGYLLHNVYVVHVEVDDLASSFRLFNVLNNRGMPLNDADLLKNALLQKVAGDDGLSEHVEQNWLQIEQIVGEQELGAFLSHHQISEKTNRDRVKKKIFPYYESRLDSGEFSGDAAKMSGMLLSSADCYGSIIGGHTNAEITTSFLSHFSKPEEWVPAFMAFLIKHGHEKFPEFAVLFEKVYMQMWLRKQPKSQREIPCYSAVAAINNDKPYAAILDDVRMCEDNEKFEEALDSSDFYDSSRPQIINLVKTVLQRVDQERHDGNVQKNTYKGKITVEHILPQKMTGEYWTKRFSKDEHKQWLHKLGNLTLISSGKNSAARNFGFDEKKAAYEMANKKCSFDITKQVCDLPEWNMQTMRERHETLKREIMELWRVDKKGNPPDALL